MYECSNTYDLNRYIILFRIRQIDSDATVFTFQRYVETLGLVNVVQIESSLDVTTLYNIVNSPITTNEQLQLDEFLADRQSVKDDYGIAVTKLLSIESRANADWTNALVFDTLRFFAKVIRLILKFLYKRLM